MWNALPVAVLSEDVVEKFKKTLKTMLLDIYDELKKKAFK